MLGAIPGDIVGSVYEGRKKWLENRNPDFKPLFARKSKFTDDTVLTLAVADAVLNSRNIVETLKAYCNSYPNAGYGKSFKRWAYSDFDEPYGSFGNGGAMRVSPIAYAFGALDEVIKKAREFTEVTHNHPEGIRGAQAVASAIFLARSGESKQEIERYVSGQFGYALDGSIESLRVNFQFDSSAQGSVPQAITAALESTSYENAIRLAVSLGGDSDTLASMAGAIAAPLHGGVPPNIATQAFEKLDEHLQQILSAFCKKYAT